MTLSHSVFERLIGHLQEERNVSHGKAVDEALDETAKKIARVLTSAISK